MTSLPLRLLFAACWLGLAFGANADDGPYSRATLLAHRGVHQDFHRDGLDAATCTAARIYPPTHAFLENTIESIAEAFRHGANMVEIDVHPTTDGEFVVFHDWRLECRTNGEGVTRGKALAYLKSLDIGHGYTADGGKTFPFRGKFVGAMPTWGEVAKAFPKSRFLVNIKSNDPAEGRAAVAYARRHDLGTEYVSFSGGDRPIEAIRQDWPGVRTMSRARLKSCALGYAAIGWTSYVPQACRDAIIVVPLNYTGLAWGWPNTFVARMAEVNSEVFAMGPYGDGYGTTGVDTLELLNQLPTDYTGGIMTDRIEVIGKAARPQ